MSKLIINFENINKINKGESMKSLKMKLTLALIMMFVAIAMLIVGIYAAETQSIKLNGTVNFDIKDKCLYVQDVRLQESMESSPYSLKEQGRFMPGYINGNFNMNLGTFTNTYGSFALYFDIINTIDETSGETSSYTVESNTTQSGVSVSAIVDNESNTIPQGTVTPSQITQDTSISASLKVTISAQTGTNVDLSQITITISEFVGLKINVISSNETIGQAQSTTAVIGEEVTLTATFTGTQDGDFLGWRANSVDGELVSTSPTYTFMWEEDSPINYYAIFESSSDTMVFALDTPSSGKATLSSATGVDIIVPAVIYRNNVQYTVTDIKRVYSTYAPGGDMSVISSTVETVVLPETLISIGFDSFGSSTSLLSVEFKYCTNLMEIGGHAFQSCQNLTNINLSNCIKLTSIGDHAFSYCSSLTSVTIPDSVESIGSHAFSNCSSLTSVDMSGCTNLTIISIYAFAYCSSLTSVKFPSTTGWFVTESLSATSGTEMDMSNPEQNATWLTAEYGEDYYGYYFKRNA